MITHLPGQSWLGMIFAYRNTVLQQIIKRILLTTAFSVGITYLHLKTGLFDGNDQGFGSSLTHLPFSFIGLALSIFLGFRNSTSYDRFWEGRKLWGQLVNSTRSLSRHILYNAQTDTAEEAVALHDWQRQMHRYVLAYVHALRLHLRDEGSEALKDYLSETEYADLSRHQNRPNYINARLSQGVAEAWKKQWINTHHMILFEERLQEFSNLQGGCERIKATPIPFLYMVLLHRLVAIYCFTLPLGIVDTVGVYTPFVVAIVSYAFMGLDAIGGRIENPFQKEAHNLPLTQLSESIEIALIEQANEKLGNTLKPQNQHKPQDNTNTGVLL